MRTRNKPHTVQSLLELTSPDGECLVWRSTTRSNGYGVTTFMGKQTTTHRVMYQLFHNCEVPTDMEIDHTCNNRACINPDHLEMVSHAENMRRGLERRTHCKAGHEWNEENTYLAVVTRKQGGTRTQRYCRICRAKHQADLRKRNNKGGLVK
jgi:hypothetical protein